MKTPGAQHMFDIFHSFIACDNSAMSSYSILHDSVSGWLMLASFYYRMKHYNTALNIVSYAVSKCTTEKVYEQQNNLSNEQYALIKMKVLPFHDYQLIGMLHQDSCTRQIFVYFAI
jgi:hypothetical protein